MWRLWRAGTAASSPACTQQSGWACWYSLTGLQGGKVQLGRDAVQQDQGGATQQRPAGENKQVSQDGALFRDQPLTYANGEYNDEGVVLTDQVEREMSRTSSSERTGSR